VEEVKGEVKEDRETNLWEKEIQSEVNPATDLQEQRIWKEEATVEIDGGENLELEVETLGGRWSVANLGELKSGEKKRWGVGAVRKKRS